jgi:hypothetical protein
MRYTLDTSQSWTYASRKVWVNGQLKKYLPSNINVKSPTPDLKTSLNEHYAHTSKVFILLWDINSNKI